MLDQFAERGLCKHTRLNCLINIHIFDYPDSRLSGLFTLVPPSPDNRGSTVSLLSSVSLEKNLPAKLLQPI